MEGTLKLSSVWKLFLAAVKAILIQHILDVLAFNP